MTLEVAIKAAFTYARMARGSTAVLQMGLLGSLSHQDLQKRLEQLAEKLDRLAVSHAPRRPSSRVDQRMRPGIILKAVSRVLEQATQPMRTCEVHKAVVALLQREVLYSAVKGCLARQALGQQARFERTARGHYQVRRVD